ncbi:hypothetical protein LB504_011649 [Fusarium proliferatum]|nr:hypothetical protein LB504_011649 [Fusarium proliferatum]
MSDPFSIATGVAGLISLGITVCDGLHTYFSAIKDRKDDLAIVTQNVALFKFHIFAVQSSASKFGHRHSPAINGLQLSLINCEMQLQCLQKLLSELMPTGDPSLSKGIWRSQKLIARYPFDRKKLVQLEEYLLRANTTLCSFIQALNLDISIRMSDELEAFKMTLESIDINTQTTSRTISTRLDITSPRVESSTLQYLPSRIKDATVSSSNNIVLHQAAVGVAETKASFNGSVQSFEDIYNAYSTPHYLQNAEIERRLYKKLADMDRTCGASSGKTSNRPAGWTYRFWGGLTVSRQGDVQINHRLGCIFFQRSKRHISRTSATYFGLLSLFSQSFTISLTQEYPGGPYSVSFGLQPCNIIFYSRKNGDRLGCLADSVIKELRAIYRSGKASPFDVDQRGNNIAHLCLEACLYTLRFEKPLKSSGREIDAIYKMLSYLADIGVPITASNFNQSNILTLPMNYRNIRILPRLYKLVVIHDSSFYSTDLAHKGSPSTYPLRASDGDKLLKQLEILHIGFSELFLAVITQDHQRLQSVLLAEDSLLDISQIDLFGRNILHASCNWPDGLRLLLQRQDVRPLIDMATSSHSPLSPLDCALFYSKIHCNAPDQWTECHNCRCYVGVQLLLEADCKVTVGWIRTKTLRGCSWKARNLLFMHLKDRRQRLRNIALSILPQTVLRQYGVATTPLPDKTAVLLWSKLQQIKDQQHHRVWLPGGINPCNSRHTIIPESLFDFPNHLRVIELALDYGFAPRDENGVQPLLSGRHIIPDSVPWASEDSMKYLDWLFRQNLCPELSFKPFQLSFLHRIAAFIGPLISYKIYEASLSYQDISIPELQGSGTLILAICDNKYQCNIPCPCSSGIFTRPLAHILPTVLQRQIGMQSIVVTNLYQQRELGIQSTHFFLHIRGHIKLVVICISMLKISQCSSEYLYMAKCAIHILTMMSLGVRHLPICSTSHYDDLQDSMGNEDWKEILHEDRELIDQLEALDQEFGDVFDRQNVSIEEFLLGYWLTRMKEIILEFHKPLTHHDRYKLLEAGVVLEEDNADGSEFFDDMMYVR